MIKRWARGGLFRLVLRGEKGQSIVEFVLIAPLLLAALYVPADFGVSLFTAHLAENAVREGTRIGTGLLPCSSSPKPCLEKASDVSCPSTNDVATEVCTRLPQMLNDPLVTVEPLDTGSTNCMRSVRVKVSGTYNFFLYHLAYLVGVTNIPSTMTMTRSTQMRYTYQPPGDDTNYNTPCTAVS